MTTTNADRTAEAHRRVQTWIESPDGLWVTRCRCGWVSEMHRVRGASIGEWDEHVDEHHATACRGDSAMIGTVRDGERNRRITRVCDGRNIGVHAEVAHSMGRVVSRTQPHGTPDTQICDEVGAILAKRASVAAALESTSLAPNIKSIVAEGLTQHSRWEAIPILRTGGVAWRVVRAERDTAAYCGEIHISDDMTMSIDGLSPDVPDEDVNWLRQAILKQHSEHSVVDLAPVSVPAVDDAGMTWAMLYAESVWP